MDGELTRKSGQGNLFHRDAGLVAEGRLAADHRTLSEVERAMRRVVDKLLHAPTVRVKDLAGSPGGDAYEDALRWALAEAGSAALPSATVASPACSLAR